MKSPIKRRLQAAENVCRELRFYLASKVVDQDFSRVVPMLQKWMELAPDELKYSRPEGVILGWMSCAKRPESLLSFGYEDHDNTTRDTHDTEEQARAVCNILATGGLGGEGVHFPLKTWVEPIYDPDPNSKEKKHE